MDSVLRITPLNPTIGAEVEGIDVSQPISQAVGRKLREALGRHKVLVFRDQPMTPQQQYDLGASFGSVEKSLVDSGHAPTPGVMSIVSSQAKGLTAEWHTDHSFSEVPPMAALLHAVTLPSCGGDTVWSNTAAAYEALSAPMRAMLDNLTAAHTTERMMKLFKRHEKSFKLNIEKDSVTHPLVRVHPDTGEKALYICPLYTSHINELSEDESDALLSFLYRHMAKPEFQFRLIWAPNTSVIWDEATTIHYAAANYDEPRVMNRLIVEGSRPRGTGTLANVA